MTAKVFAGTISIALLFSCNKKEESSVEESIDIINTSAEETTENECYRFTKNNDTVTLSMTRNGSKATGKLAYNFFDKDDSNGEFSGVIKGDTLVADFTFKSEGTTSVREVVFLKSKNSYLPGYGDMEEQNGKQVFKNPNALQFDDIVVLIKIGCK